jgi:hypothetical protein
MVKDRLQENMAIYDKNGEMHYDIISAFIKSVRGSDPDAAVYWLARMLEGGEDIKFITPAGKLTDNLYEINLNDYDDYKIIYHIGPSSTVKIAETTGAGDAFASGFVSGLIKEKTIEESLKLGCVQSESVIAAHGAKNKLLTIQEAEEKIKIFDGKLTQKESVSKKKFELSEFSIAPEDKGFCLQNGKVIRSIEELAYFLKYAPENLVSSHIGSDFNHFADWIENVFHKDSLAKLIREKDDKKSISECLLASVNN